MSDRPLNDLTRSELEHVFASHGLNAFQARLAFQNLHRNGARTWDKFEHLSIAARKLLPTLPALPQLNIDKTAHASDGTIKLRIGIAGTSIGDAAIESVIIPTPNRVTLCVSSQAGCGAGCAFCHTATMGLLRNLSAWEIVEQHRLATQLWRERHPNVPITNIVFMGMGEPLHNEEQVVRACEILGDDLGAGFPERRLVVSTAGVGARIRPFWERRAGALALSLHATTDELRDKLVPLNRQCNLAELRRILLEIPWRPRESLTIAYLLLQDINDTREDAQRLAAWVQGMPAKINLLEFNPFPGCEFKRASSERLSEFRQWLHDFGAFHTLRHSRGEDAVAACGQLASEGRPRRFSTQRR